MQKPLVIVKDIYITIIKNKEELFVYLAKDSMRNWHDKWEIAEKQYTNATGKLYGIAKFVLYNYKNAIIKSRTKNLPLNPSANPSTIQTTLWFSCYPFKNISKKILDEGIQSGEFYIEKC